MIKLMKGDCLVRKGRNFIGIELESVYFADAKNNIREEKRKCTFNRNL